MVSIKKNGIMCILASIILTVALLCSPLNIYAANVPREFNVTPNESGFTYNGIKTFGISSCRNGNSKNIAFDEVDIVYKGESFYRMMSIFPYSDIKKGLYDLRLRLVLGDACAFNKIIAYFYTYSGAPLGGRTLYNNVSGSIGTPIEIEFNNLRTNSDIGIIQLQFHVDTSTVGYPVTFESLDLSFIPVEDPVGAINDLDTKLTSPDPIDKAMIDEFRESMGSQSSEIDDLVGDMDSLVKPDVNDFNSDLSGIVSNESISMYSNTLSAITESKLVLSILTITFTIAICGYALFGKRG